MIKHLKIIGLVGVFALSAPAAQANHCSTHENSQEADHSSHKMTTGRPDIVDTAVGAGQFQTLAAALTAAELVDVLKSEGPFTVFAPTDAAFAKLPAGTVETLLKPENREQLVSILTYHVVAGRVEAAQVLELDTAETVNGQRVEIKFAGGKVDVDGATVVKTDIEASNGIIHVIDTVLLPESENILGVADKAGQFKTLLAAVEAAGLSEVLMGEGPFTVFAPTDGAFADLPEGTVASLLEKQNRGKLQKILKYHAVSGRIYSPEVLGSDRIETLAGENLVVSMRKGQALVNDSAILATDIDAANGVVHVIDSVLLPSERHSSRTSPAELIEMAIERGAPLYNHGNHAACSAAYEMTARSLLNLGAEIPAGAKVALSEALSKMEKTDDPDSQAWIMRRGLDEAHRHIRLEMASAP